MGALGVVAAENDWGTVTYKPFDEDRCWCSS